MDGLKERKRIIISGIILSSLGLFAVIWSLSPVIYGRIHLVRILGAGLLGFALLLLGMLFILTRTRQLLFHRLLWFFSASVTIIIFLLACELLLSFSNKRRLLIEHVYYKKYVGSYNAFCIQHLHPFYYFFFTQKPEEIKKINNSVCSIDNMGFRGSNPANKGKRKLAFIIGGSAAFGHGSSSNETTISGYLNMMQNEYYFVNAGVPSWNSTQEFYRLSLQLVQFAPSLIVAYDGYNDASVCYRYAKKGFDYPEGAPESYEFIQKKVDDIRHESPLEVKVNLDMLFLPYLRGYLSSKNAKTKIKNSMPILSGSMKKSGDAAAAAYLKNIQLMNRISRSYGIYFVVVAQPHLFLHKNVSNKSLDILDYCSLGEMVEYYKHFNRRVFARGAYAGKILDFTRLFDARFKEIPLGDIFVDAVHLFDEGNKIVAEELWKNLKQQ